MAGYTRQSEASIQPGQDIDAGPLNTEFDAVESAFDASTGHSHDGTTGNGPKLGLTSFTQINAKKVLGNMSGSTANVGEVSVLDEDNMATNSDTALATQQSIKAYVDSGNSNTVANGKTGATTFTDGGVLVGNGTGAVQSTSAGTAGQVLTSNGAGNDPTFQTIGGGFGIGDTLMSTTALSSPWLKEDGRKVSQTTYSALFALLGHSQSPVRYPMNTNTIANPASPPPGSVLGIRWSPNGRYQAISHSTSPYVTIYDWSTGVPVKIADPATLPTNRGQHPGWSPDNRYLAVPHWVSPYVTIYDWSTGVPVKITNPATLPTGDTSDADWSPNGRYLAVAHVNSPYVTIYDWSTGSPVKITNPATLPPADGISVKWSPNGRYLAVGHGGSPYVTIYDWSTGVPVKITNPATLPGSTVYGVSWSPDGRYLATSHLSSPYVTIYDWSTGSPVKITNPATLPSDLGWDVEWSPNGKYLTVTSNASPYVIIYDWTSGIPVKITNPATLPPSAAWACGWSPDSRYLTVGHSGTNYMVTYDGAERPASDFYLRNVPPIGSLNSYIKSS